MNLIIDDEAVDLYPSAQMFYSVQRANIGQLAQRAVSFSNNFDVPWTEKNARLFGFAGNEDSASLLPFQLRNCRLENNGFEPNQQVVLYITNALNTRFKVQIYENIFDFFQAIKGKSLLDILAIPDSPWEASDIDTARNTTSGIISAIVNYGRPIYDVDFFLPSFYYHSIIIAILEFTGLNLSGDILTDERFTDLVIPYAGPSFEYSETYFSQHFYKTVVLSTTNITNSINAEVSLMGEIVTQYKHGTIFAQVSVGGVPGINWGTGNNLILRLKKNGVTVASTTIATNPTGSALITFEYPDFAAPGDQYNFYIYSDAMSGPGIDYTIFGSALVDITYYEFRPDGKVNREMVNWNELLKDVQCEDLLRDFFNRYGIVPKQELGTMYLKTIENIIIDQGNAVDWSSKLVNRDSKEIKFMQDYAQQNDFSYDDLAEDVDLGRGSIDIDNDTLDLRKSLFETAFGNALMSNYLGWFLASVPVYDASSVDIYDFQDEPGLRVLTLKDRVSEDAITFDATPRTDYKIGYFVDANKTKDTGFQYFLDQFYTSLTESLQTNRAVIKYFRLNEDDVFNYDFHKMIYDGEGYYLLNKIVNFYPDRISKVELFKVL